MHSLRTPRRCLRMPGRSGAPLWPRWRPRFSRPWRAGDEHSGKRNGAAGSSYL